jgi:hypothetical protein
MASTFVDSNATRIALLLTAAYCSLLAGLCVAIRIYKDIHRNDADVSQTNDTTTDIESGNIGI